jgi:hypothetical protein
MKLMDVLLVTVLVAWGVAFAPEGVRGQAEARTREVPGYQSVPVLYGHTFVQPALMRSPFVRTVVSNEIAAGVATDIPERFHLLPEGDTVVSLDGDITVAALQFSYQHALRDWLAAYGTFRLGARTGTEVASLLQSGVTFATGFELGWLAQIRETERSLLSGSLTISNSSATVLDMVGWLEGITDGGNAQLVRTVPALGVAGALHYAWVLNQVVAFYGTASGKRGESTLTRSTGWFWAGALGTSVNFMDRYRVPLGLSFTARFDSDPALQGRVEGDWQAVGLRMVYTGRSDMELALELGTTRVPFDEDDYMRIQQFGVGLHYFF